MAVCPAPQIANAKRAVTGCNNPIWKSKVFKPGVQVLFSCILFSEHNDLSSDARSFNFQ
jgi:hypothetical protein